MSLSPSRAARTGRRAGVLALALLACTPGGAAASDVLFGLTDSRELISLRSDLPGVPETRNDVTGLPKDSVILGLDTRPSTGELVAAVREGGTLVLYRVDPTTATATRLSSGGAQIGSSTSTASIAFTPDADTLRVVTPTKHLLITPASGAATVQAPLSYAPGDKGETTAPSPVGITYLPSDGGVSPALVLDGARHALTEAGSGASPVSTGLLSTVRQLPFPIAAHGAIDTSPGDGSVYLSISDEGQQQSNLYATPADMLTPGYVGPFPVKDPVVGLAVGAGGLFDFDRPAYRVREADGSVTVPILRSGTMTAPADITFEVADDSAQTGIDLPATVGVVGFGAGQDRATLEIPISPDAIPEGEEIARIRMTGISGPAGLGFRRQARISIVDGGVTSAAAGGGGVATPRPLKPPVAAAGLKSPRLSVTVTAPSLRRLSRRLSVPFTCTAACKVQVEARLDRKNARKIKRPAFLGRSTRSLTRAGKGRVRVTVPNWKRWSKRYGRVRRGSVSLKVRAYSAEGRRVARLSLRAPIRR